MTTGASAAPTHTNTPTYTLEYARYDGTTLASCNESERTELDTSTSQLFMRGHAIMRSCEHARRAPSADPAAEPVHAGHHPALGEAHLLVEVTRGLVRVVDVEM